MVRQFQRIIKMKNDRLPKIVFLWDKKISEQNNFSTWYKEIKTIHETYNMTHYFNNNLSCNLEMLRLSMEVKQSVELRNKCALKPKIKLYNEIAEFGKTPTYLSLPLTFRQKMFIAKLRLSALPIRIETGRFERPRLPPNERLCASCRVPNAIENEEHFMFVCPSYDNLRKTWMASLSKGPGFDLLSASEKLRSCFNVKENVKVTAKYVIDCFDLLK